MIAIWVITLILASLGNLWAIQLATWFGSHVLITILLLLLLA